MKNIDQTIKQALEQEDQEWFDSLGEQTPLGQMIDSFKTRNRLMIVVSMVFGLVMTVLAFWFTYRMFQAGDVRTTVLWAAGLFFTVHGISMMKLWYFMELNKNTMIREIKRVELQVARMMAKQNGGD